jgi:hypothetical protein
VQALGRDRRLRLRADGIVAYAKGIKAKVVT